MSRAHNPDHCTPADIGIEKLDGLLQADSDALDAYFAYFAVPTVVGNGERKHECCLNCGGRFDGVFHAMGLAVAQQWDLVHGEARCTGCGWPSRGMHYVKREDGTDVCTLRNRFLQYHPDEVTATTEEDRAA